MRNLILVAALSVAACATDPTHGLSAAELREANHDSGPRPMLATDGATIEGAVKAKLKDPESARFEWPYDFRLSDYRPIGGSLVHGWLTCGSVNARNGFGGYTGKTAVVIVIDNGSPILVDMDSPAYHPVANMCAQAGMPIL